MTGDSPAPDTRDGEGSAPGLQAHTPGLTAPPPTPAGIRHHWGKALLAIVSILATIAVLWFLARQNRGFSLEQFASVFSGMHLGWFAFALALCLAAYIVRGLRWASFVAPYAPHPSLVDIVANTFIGFAAVVIIGRPAELLRPYLLARQLGVSFPSQVGAWMLERIYDLLSILALAGWALLTIDAASLPPESPIGNAIHTGGGIVFGASVAALGVLLAFTFAVETASQRLRDALAFLPQHRRETVYGLIETFSSALGVSRHPAILLRVISWTLLHWAVVGLATWAIFQSFSSSAHLSLSEAFRFLAILALASAIPIPFLVGGFYLVSLALLTEWLRLPLEDSSGITLVTWVLQMGIAIPIGALAALRSGLNWRKIKSMKQEAHL
ncbi:MAG: lysylphosphatidylglycerol synthase transmembrane domain-containing protein [Bryobacterales bacterium]|nr:lysylphosphatidylglycerol synthase transmembrane domain-containing protein [Bryobacterales bacterium]